MLEQIRKDFNLVLIWAAIFFVCWGAWQFQYTGEILEVSNGVVKNTNYKTQATVALDNGERVSANCFNQYDNKPVKVALSVGRFTAKKVYRCID